MKLRNQKGFSLLEVLAALTLLSVVLSVAFLLFGSINQLFNQSAQDYTDKTDLRTTMNTISAQMAEATSVRLHSYSELRFHSFGEVDNEALAIVYNSVDHTISLNRALDVTDGDLTTGTFTLLFVMAENVYPDSVNAIPAFSVSHYNGTDWDDLTTDITLAEDTDLIRVTMNFALTQSSQQNVNYKQMEAVIPIVKDTIE